MCRPGKDQALGVQSVAPAAGLGGEDKCEPSWSGRALMGAVWERRVFLKELTLAMIKEGWEEVKQGLVLG